MNPNLLIAIPMCMDDAVLAERLLDWVYELNGKTQRGHVLLAYAHDVHQEMKLKCRICAELAFESVSEFTASNRPLSFNNADTKNMVVELKTKVEFINNLFNQTAHHIAGHYRWPWLWCEPDCVPITPDWIDKLSKAYQSQPKKFLGRKMQRGPAESVQVFFSRIGIYPTSAYGELRGFIGSPPFEWAAGNHIVSRGANSKLIQPGVYNGDVSSIAPETVLYHSDKTGKLIEHLREKMASTVEAPEHTNGEAVAVRVTIPELVQEVTRMPEIEIKDRLSFPTVNVGPDFGKVRVDSLIPDADPEPQVDKRTKEYREWRARQQSKA